MLRLAHWTAARLQDGAQSQRTQRTVRVAAWTDCPKGRVCGGANKAHWVIIVWLVMLVGLWWRLYLWRVGPQVFGGKRLFLVIHIYMCVKG